MIQSLVQQISGASHWQIDVVAICLLLQGCIAAVFPEEVVITTLGLLWSHHRIGFFEAMAAAQLGLLPANAATVFVAGRLGTGIFERRPFRWILSRDAVERATRLVRQHSSKIIVVTRFTPTVRGPVYAALGLSRLGLGRFMKLDAMASCVQIPLLLWLGSAIGAGSGSLIDAYRRIAFLAVFLVISGILVTACLRIPNAALKQP